MRIVFVLSLILLACSLSFAQPALAPAPAAAGGFDVVTLLKQLDGAATGMCDELLASKRLEGLKGEGLIVAPLWTNVDDKKDDWIKNLVMLTQEKLTTQMIRLDKDAHFEVVDRAKLDAAMKAQKLDADAVRNPAVWPELSKVAGAKYLLTGCMIVMPVHEAPLTVVFVFTTRVINLETGRALSASGADFIFTNGPAAPAGAK